MLHELIILLGKFLGLESLDHRAGDYLTFKKLPDVSKGCTIFCAHQVYECSSSVFSQIYLINLRHSKRSVVVAHCGFSLYFPND